MSENGIENILTCTQLTHLLYAKDTTKKSQGKLAINKKIINILSFVFCISGYLFIFPHSKHF